MSPRTEVARHSRWPYWSLIPFGFGAWAPLYGGVRAREPKWIALGALWTAMIVVALILAGGHGHAEDGIVGALAIIAWIGGATTSFAIRAAYDQRLASPLAQAAQRGELQLRDRAQALRIARENPPLAQQMGIGRPDVPGSADGGVVDVNNASATALLRLPRMSDELVTHIVEARGKVNGFSSLEDMGTAMDLDGDVVEALRDRVVFLPRG